MSERANLSRNTLRLSIAARAAQLMAEEGVTDYGFAKRKAARQLGVGEGEALPTNAQIEEALRAHQALYQDEEQQALLRELRLVAVEVMRLCAAFRPYLTGAVLDGTAGRYASVEIDLFAESAKEVEIFFLNQMLNYEHLPVRGHLPQAPEAILELDWEGTPVRLNVYDSYQERGPRPSNAPHRKPKDRAKLATVEALLNSPPLHPVIEE